MQSVGIYFILGQGIVYRYLCYINNNYFHFSKHVMYISLLSVLSFSCHFYHLRNSNIHTYIDFLYYLFSSLCLGHFTMFRLSNRAVFSRLTSPLRSFLSPLQRKVGQSHKSTIENTTFCTSKNNKSYLSLPPPCQIFNLPIFAPYHRTVKGQKTCQVLRGSSSTYAWQTNPPILSLVQKRFFVTPTPTPAKPKPTPSNDDKQSNKDTRDYAIMYLGYSVIFGAAYCFERETMWAFVLGFLWPLVFIYIVCVCAGCLVHWIDIDLKRYFRGW